MALLYSKDENIFDILRSIVYSFGDKKKMHAIQHARIAANCTATSHFKNTSKKIVCGGRRLHIHLCFGIEEYFSIAKGHQRRL